MTMWTMYYTGTQENIIAANAQIDSNCGFPDPQTQTWDIPAKAYNQDFWFISMPKPEGYMNSYGTWTQSQMINGVTNVTEEQSNSSWWPPFPPEQVQKSETILSKVKGFLVKGVSYGV